MDLAILVEEQIVIDLTSTGERDLLLRHRIWNALSALFTISLISLSTLFLYKKKTYRDFKPLLWGLIFLNRTSDLISTLTK